MVLRAAEIVVGIFPLQAQHSLNSRGPQRENAKHFQRTMTALMHSLLPFAPAFDGQGMLGQALATSVQQSGAGFGSTNSRNPR